jgi:hypothetical protein
MFKQALSWIIARSPRLRQTDVMCRIFGHDYKLKRKITPYLREIECKNCKKQFGMHDELRCVFLPLDDELRSCNDDLAKLYGT